jgi:cation transport protein ChaC
MASVAADLWVFGYGSLMWRPHFDYEEAARARVAGFRRCFCIYSTHHRGTPERPGIVLGLDRGGECTGMAFRIAASRAAETIAYLREREQVYGVYREAPIPITIDDGGPRRHVSAMAYIVERWHPTYTGRLMLIEQAHLIRRAEGLSGTNLDYLVNTVRHLRALGIRDRMLERLLALTAPHLSGRSDDGNAAGHSAAARALMRSVRLRGVVDAPQLKLEQRRRFFYRQRVGTQRA